MISGWGKGRVGDLRSSHGLALGADSQNDIVPIAQHQSKICNQAYDSEIVKCDMLIKAKQGQVSMWMDMAKIHQEVGDKSAVQESMGKAKGLLAKISKIGDKLSKLKNGRSEVSAKVDAY